jgi:hypothetical protein
MRLWQFSEQQYIGSRPGGGICLPHRVAHFARSPSRRPFLARPAAIPGIEVADPSFRSRFTRSREARQNVIRRKRASDPFHFRFERALPAFAPRTLLHLFGWDEAVQYLYAG